MKNLILGIALVGFAVGCKNTDNNQVSDPSTAPAPEGACADASGCCAEKSDCSAEATECSEGEAKTCPVTGETIN